METKRIKSVHDSHLGCFRTHSGIEVDIMHPTPQMIQPEDIAHALANICRFGGQSERFYSVAQHSVIVCLLAPIDLKAEALLHDAAEAYVGDVIKPIKILLGERYESIEAGFMKAVCERFGLSPAKLVDVKKYDRIVLELEHEYLINGNGTPLLNAIVEAQKTEHAYNFVDPFNSTYAKPLFVMAFKKYIDPHFHTYPGPLIWQD